MTGWSAAVLLVLLAAPARAYRVDLVPATPGPEAEDIEGTLTITGADGLVRVAIESVNDAEGLPLDGLLEAHLKLRVNGRRRRVAIALAVEAGDGEAFASLGLAPGDRVAVGDVRVRGPGRRTLAVAGVVAESPPPTVPPAPPPSPEECPAALASCAEDLAECSAELDECELLDLARPSP